MTSLLNDGHPFLYADRERVGVSRSQLVAAIAAGDVIKVFDRVYRDADAEDTREARIEAARLVVPAHAVLCDETAAWVWGVDAHRPSDRHQFTPRWVVPHGRGRARLTGVDCRQALIDPADVVEVHGMAVTRPVRTTADLLRKQYRPHALASADAMARAGLVRPMDLRAYLVGLKGYRGIRQARVLSRYVDARAASPGESWMRLRIIDAGFPVPEPQVEVIDAAGLRRFLDLAYRRRKVAAEFDGRQFHTAETDVALDLDRRRLVAAIGYRFVLADYEGIFGKDPRFECELGEILGITPIPRWWW